MRLPVPVLVIAICWAVEGCGGSGANPSFATGGTQDDGGGEASMPGPPMLGMSTPVVDSGAPPTLLVSTDAGPRPPPMGACKPGTYAGMFTTTVTVPDGGLLSDLVSIDWSGTLSLTLVGKTTTAQSGEFTTTTLVIAPGAMLMGSDQYGGTFNATVSGQLDCPSRALVGTLANGSYTNPVLDLVADGGTVTMVGTLSGTYDPNVSPVALDNGAISASSPDIQGLEADGTWSATLQ